MPVTADGRSLALWVFGLVLEGGAGCLAAFGIDTATTGLSPELVGVAGGLGAPALLRQRFAQLNGIPLGVAYFYERGRGLIDRALDRRGRRLYSRWRSKVAKELLLGHNQLQELGDRLLGYVSDVEDVDDAATDAKRLAAAVTIQRALDDPGEDEKKMKQLLDLAHQQYDADGVVDDVFRDATGRSLRAPVVTPRRFATASVAFVVIAALIVATSPFDDDRPLPPIEVGVGQPLRLENGVNYIVKKVQTVRQIEPQAVADGVYVILELQLDNESPRARPVKPSAFAVETPGGGVLTPARKPATVLQSSLTPLRLPPEARATRLLAFDVPRNELEGSKLRIDAAAEAESRDGAIDLRLRDDRPPIQKKVFHGGTTSGVPVLQLSFRTRADKVYDIAIRGPRSCRVTNGKAAAPAGEFAYMHRNGIVISGRLVTSLEAAGRVTQKVAHRRRCIRRGRTVGWQAQARP